jgi:hypothetical protein
MQELQELQKPFPTIQPIRATEALMTPAQKREMQQFTYIMKVLLHHAEKLHPTPVKVGGSVLRPARMLEQRGFIALSRAPDPGWHNVHLTDAGREAAGAQTLITERTDEAVIFWCDRTQQAKVILPTRVVEGFEKKARAEARRLRRFPRPRLIVRNEPPDAPEAA